MGRLGRSHRTIRAAAKSERALARFSISGSTTAIRSSSSTITRSKGCPGAVRILGYRNQINSGRFADAITAFRSRSDEERRELPCGRATTTARRTSPRPICAGCADQTSSSASASTSSSSSQRTSASSARVMYSDGQTEVDAYDSADGRLLVRRRREGHAVAPPVRRRGHRASAQLDLELARAVPRDGRRRRIHRRRSPQTGRRGTSSKSSTA